VRAILMLLLVMAGTPLAVSGQTAAEMRSYCKSIVEGPRGCSSDDLVVIRRRDTGTEIDYAFFHGTRNEKGPSF
jgi:hypothetical protein